MNKDIMIVKRDGRRESLNVDKIHFVVDEACNGLSGVSASQIEMNANLQFYDGMTTTEIQNILIRSASDLISLEAPNYQYAAARLLLYGLYKQVFGDYKTITLQEMIEQNVARNVYDSAILESYDEVELKRLNSFINHKRDENFTYAGLQQVVDKYLCQDRSSGEVFETPQYMYMMIAATIFSNYPKETRLQYVRKYYDAISLFKINIPTPIMGGVRTPLRQFASCVLVDVDDSLDSIFSSDMAIGYYTAQRAGIGINVGRIRGINSKIRGGEVAHTGIIPFLKKFESTVRSTTQNGIRGGSSTVYIPLWHQEIEDVMVLKNNKGTEDNRVRKLDYGIQLNKTMYERLLSGENITLFSPHDVPGLYDAYFGDPDEFKTLYEKYEKDNITRKKSVPAIDLFNELLKERAETGRIYIMNVDHSNTHSSFKDRIYFSNLCAEITLPTIPINHIDDPHGEIATCILSAINVGLIKEFDDLEELCDLAVRALDEIIDYQKYPVLAAENFTKNRRALGIGYIGLAHFLAKHHVKYSDPEAWKLVHDLSEAFQYYLLKSSNQLAREKGVCAKYDTTKYADGVLPIDTYKKAVDEVVPNVLNYDWESLREDIKRDGLRHSTLSSEMPSESSSVTSNATNGIEPPRGHLSVKKSKKGTLKQIVPQYQSLKNHYTLLWDMESNEGYFNIVAVMQKFYDQSISANWSYNPTNYENNEIPMSVIMNDLLMAYKLGHKTAYYLNTYDYKTEEVDLEDKPLPLLELTSDDSDDEACESCTI